MQKKTKNKLTKELFYFYFWFSNATYVEKQKQIQTLETTTIWRHI